MSAFAFEMNDRGIGKIIVDIPGLFQPIAQIDVLRIHKVVVVKRPCTGERSPADPKTGAGQYGRRVGLAGRQVPQVIGGEEPGMREKRRQAK